YDTLKGAITGQDEIDNRPHSTLNIRVVERSLQWSYDYASDFVLFDYEITNVGFKTLDNVYMGIYVDGDVHHLSKTGLAAYGDDICGFKQTFEAECGFQDTVNVAYIFDNDGDPEGGLWSPSTSVRSLAGVRLIRTPSDTLEYAFNWWSALPGPDFGPRKRGTLKNPFRDMNGIFGAPVGDKNKYYIMSNGEFDYDQLFTAVDHSAEGWLPPPPEALTFVQGGDPRYLLSFGPFKIFPGETLPITFAYLGGEFFHGEPDDFNTLLVNNPFTPEDYYNSLDFSDLSRNSRWASWIYDNPGVDTDGDKDFGKFRICILEEATVIETTLVIDTIVIPPDTVFDTVLIIDTIIVPTLADTNFYEGDGVPDFRGAAPPPAPKVRLIPDQGMLTVRWNGFISETTKDPFSDTADFEGFRVWTSPTLQEEDFVLKSSFDHENYNRYVFNRTENFFELLDPPFTLEQIHNMYGAALDPLNFGIDNPFIFYHQPSGTDTTYYFTAQDWNADDLSDTTAIHKRFPNALEPSAIPSEWTAEDTTDEGYLKYYEYQFYLEDLLPSIPLYVSVTAFDFGSPST
ncbi:MAG: hypothetical protein IIB00_10995, partial [candidate division Zixibacteria bacterium]|nr:hypothetical protein [candidate division Zixibacteria bacterium]